MVLLDVMNGKPSHGLDQLLVGDLGAHPSHILPKIGNILRALSLELLTTPEEVPNVGKFALLLHEVLEHLLMLKLDSLALHNKNSKI